MAKTISFGTPEGVAEGQWFKDHDALYEAGLHRFRGQGISGTEKTGVDSIVLSGGYVDDVYGDLEIIYTGEGGRDRDTGQLVADQSMASPGNAGLLVNQALGHPVRVIRGLKIKGKKRRRATGGYEYRGLYRVAGSWATTGKEGFRICQFKLLKLAPGEEVKPQPISLGDDEETDFEQQVRRAIAYERLVRDSAVVKRVKEMYDNTCQICANRLVVSPVGAAYSEAAHIQAVGKPHDGPDIIDNVLCLCPNCHALFDRGALQITDEYDVINGLTKKFVSVLHRAQAHNIRTQFIKLHRARWAGRQAEVVLSDDQQ